MLHARMQSLGLSAPNRCCDSEEHRDHWPVSLNVCAGEVKACCRSEAAQAVDHARRGFQAGGA